MIKKNKLGLVENIIYRNQLIISIKLMHRLNYYTKKIIQSN